MIKFNFMKETTLNLHSAILKAGFQKSHYLLQPTFLLSCEYHAWKLGDKQGIHFRHPHRFSVAYRTILLHVRTFGLLECVNEN